MLGRSALRAVAARCTGRGMRWTPARSDDGSPALLLERRGQPAAEAMLVLLRDDGFWLVDGNGDALASASDLPALLDALDGGVAETPRRKPERQSAAPPLARLLPAPA